MALTTALERPPGWTEFNTHLNATPNFGMSVGLKSCIEAWAVGDYFISLKVLISPHKEIYSFKLTMLWLSLSSSLSAAKYFHQYSMHTTTVA